MVKSPSQQRLPRWSLFVIAAGGILTYCGVGVLLIGLHFMRDLESALEDPIVFAGGDLELLAPFFLLLIPAVLGALATRELLRIVMRGIHDGKSPMAIAISIIAFLASALLLVIVAFVTSYQSWH